MERDFRGLADHLLARATLLVPSWMPGGKLLGREYVCGNLSGTPGTSCKVNLFTGRWADFATNERGGDLLSLYAAIENIKQSEAYDRLVESESYSPGVRARINKQESSTFKPIPIPKNQKPPGNKAMSNRWVYKSMTGEDLFYILRYDMPDGAKVYTPMCYDEREGFVKKHWPAPRPLYGLELLDQHPNKPILIVEGEKACEAARKFASSYLVMTWPGGTNNVHQTDWSPIYGRSSVLIWPDCDLKKATKENHKRLGLDIGQLIPYDMQPGPFAATQIADHLYPHVGEIKILDVSAEPGPDGWDAADAKFKTMDEFVVWAKPLAKIYKPKTLLPELPEKPEREPVKPIIPEIMPPAHDTPPPTANDIPSEMIGQLQDVLDEHAPQKYTPAQYGIWMSCGVIMGGLNGKNPEMNADNVMAVMKKFKPLAGKFWYDTFHQKMFTTWVPNDPDATLTNPVEWNDAHESNLMMYFQRVVGFRKCSKAMIQDAHRVVAGDNHRSEPEQWLNTLSWDGINRVHSFFHRYMGVVDNDYSRAVSKNFWVSMVARVLQPGCKVDNMVILEGRQGSYKSSALNAIAGDWYVESNENISGKDFYLSFAGNLIIELGELDAFNRADTTTVKKVVSTKVDRYRPPYERSPRNVPRQCIFVGTTNEEDYLRDNTGARRFWPLLVTEIDLSGIKLDREQLFAEAVHLYKSGENWYEVPNEAQQEQERRRETDIWEPIIDQYVANSKTVLACGYTTVADVAINALNITYDKQNIVVNRRIAAILKALRLTQKNEKVKGQRLNERRFYVRDTSNDPVYNPYQSLLKDVPNMAPQSTRQ